VERLLGAAPERKQVLNLFKCADALHSAPENFGSEAVARGLVLARQLAHRGAEATFISAHAELQYRAGDLQSAHQSMMEALAIYLELADEDSVYARRVQHAAQNVIAYAGNGGNHARAAQLLQQLGELLEPVAAEQMRRAISAINR
jgi:hypothetical protein